MHHLIGNYFSKRRTFCPVCESEREMGCNLSRDHGKKAIRRETNARHTSPQGLANCNQDRDKDDRSLLKTFCNTESELKPQIHI